MSSSVPPKVLVIAGSDSGGGAGLQADLKTLEAFDVYGATIVTAVTAQNTRGVAAVHVVPADVIAAQLDAVLTDIGADAVKIGMLADATVIDVVATALSKHGCKNIVLDPVMVATSGDRLLNTDAVEALRERLVPHARIVTPNLAEAAALAGVPVDDPDSMLRAAEHIFRLGCDAVLVKGGHLSGDEVLDLYYDGEEAIRILNRRLPLSGHGTGCALSSALAAGLAQGQSATDALREATAFVHKALEHGYAVGEGDCVVLDHRWRRSHV